MGALSRRKGAAFERRCRAIMAEITGHPHWRRAPGSEVQHNGDLVPCHEDQEIITLPSGSLYVECKVTAIINKGKMDNWMETIERLRKDKDWYLLFAMDKGPVYVRSNLRIMPFGGENEFYGPVYFTFNRGGVGAAGKSGTPGLPNNGDTPQVIP